MKMFSWPLFPSLWDEHFWWTWRASSQEPQVATWSIQHGPWCEVVEARQQLPPWPPVSGWVCPSNPPISWGCGEESPISWEVRGDGAELTRLERRLRVKISVIFIFMWTWSSLVPCHSRTDSSLKIVYTRNKTKNVISPLTETCQSSSWYSTDVLHLYYTDMLLICYWSSTVLRKEQTDK